MHSSGEPTARLPAAAGLDQAALIEAVVHAARDGIIEELPESVPRAASRTAAAGLRAQGGAQVEGR